MYRKQLVAWASYVCVVGVSLFALLPALLAALPDCNSMQPPPPAECGTESFCSNEGTCANNTSVVQDETVMACVDGTPSQYAVPTAEPVECTCTYYCMDCVGAPGFCCVDPNNPKRDSAGDPICSTTPSCVDSSCNDQT